MLSPQQQRGRLRSLIVRELKRYNTKKAFQQALKDNGQYATGFLNRSIAATRVNNQLTVRSTINTTTGIIDNVNISVQIPWGRYGIKLDEEYGGAEYAEGQMTPALSSLMQWIKAKNINAVGYVKATLKSGGEKTYRYTGITGAKIMAYHIQQNIIEENELRTRYDYVGAVQFEIEQALSDAINDWISEMVGEQLADVYVEIDNIL